MAEREKIPLVDLGAQRRRLGARVDEAILRVVDHGAYIMGPEVLALESELAAFCGARHCVSCASGTDALALVLMAKGVKAGEAVICPSFTFAATAEVVVWTGATPVFADVDPGTFNLDPASLEKAFATARQLGLDPVAVISVDLFGLPADYDRIEAICRKEGAFLLSDAAQSFGASYHGRKVGSIGLATATSFFPAKPLGCYGDGGAVFTDDATLAEVMRSIRVHGQGSDKYDNVRIGINGRLDTIQAAILLEKLKIFADEIDEREKIARRYDDALADIVRIPGRVPDVRSVWAQYTVQLPLARRGAVQAQLLDSGIPTAIYYPKPLHRQIAYANYPRADELAVSDALSQTVLSLPMHPYLSRQTQELITGAVRRSLA